MPLLRRTGRQSHAALREPATLKLEGAGQLRRAQVGRRRTGVRYRDQVEQSRPDVRYPMRNGLANIRRIDVDITWLPTRIGGRMGPAPIAVEQLDIHRRSRYGDVQRRHIMYVEQCGVTRTD